MQYRRAVASLTTIERRTTVVHVGFADTLDPRHRPSITTPLTMATVLGHLRIDEVTDDEVDAAAGDES